MRIFVLDGKDMINREKAYSVIEQTLEFPDWFGHNLDALADCLSERGKDVLIVLMNRDSMLEALGDYGFNMLEVFREQSIGRYAFVEK